MTDKKSALEELYADSGAIDVKRVVAVLKPFVTIQRAGHEVFFSREGHALKTEDKMLAYVLVKKMLKAEGVIDKVGVSGKEIHLVTELPKGTIDPTMQKLKKEGLLAGSGKNYEIPVRRIEDVLTRLERYSS